MPTKKNGEYVVCETCGKVFYKTQYRLGKVKHHYCSNACAHAARSAQALENRVCKYCGKEMVVQRGDPRKFCDKQCYDKWQKATRSGENNPRYQRVKTICDWCGKEYEMKKYKQNVSKNHFCSTECRREWYKNVWSQDESWREESRKRAARILSNNDKITMTKPQEKANKILNELKIKYTNEKPYKYYSVDNYLDEYGLIIEIMGDYWHCNRQKLETINKELHLDSIRRDKAKHTYFKEYHNLEILYIWESDINNREDVVIELIKKYVSSGGVLENYHSVNYQINNNGDLVLKDDILTMYQQMELSELRGHCELAAS